MAIGSPSHVQARLVAAALLTAISLAAGCQQTPNEASSVGAIDTGTYPNLNVKPGVANTQFSAEEMEMARAELQNSAASNAARDPRVPSDEEVLRWLAKRHAREALARIEGGA